MGFRLRSSTNANIWYLSLTVDESQFLDPDDGRENMCVGSEHEND